MPRNCRRHGYTSDRRLRQDELGFVIAAIVLLFRNPDSRNKVTISFWPRASSNSVETRQLSLVRYRTRPALAQTDNLGGGNGEDIMAARCRVKVIPEQIGVRVDRGDALRAVANVYQSVFGGRGEDVIEESKDVELEKMEAPAGVEVAQDSEASGQDLVIERACFCRRNRRRGRPLSRGTRPSGGRSGMMNWVAPASMRRWMLIA